MYRNRNISGNSHVQAHYTDQLGEDAPVIIKSIVQKLMTAEKKEEQNIPDIEAYSAQVALESIGRFKQSYRDFFVQADLSIRQIPGLPPNYREKLRGELSEIKKHFKQLTVRDIVMYLVWFHHEDNFPDDEKYTDLFTGEEQAFSHQFDALLRQSGVLKRGESIYKSILSLDAKISLFSGQLEKLRIFQQKKIEDSLNRTSLVEAGTQNIPSPKSPKEEKNLHGMNMVNPMVSYKISKVYARIKNLAEGNGIMNESEFLRLKQSLDGYFQDNHIPESEYRTYSALLDHISSRINLLPVVANVGTGVERILDGSGTLSQQESITISLEQSSVPLDEEENIHAFVLQMRELQKHIGYHLSSTKQNGESFGDGSFSMKILRPLFYWMEQNVEKMAGGIRAADFFSLYLDSVDDTNPIRTTFVQILREQDIILSKPSDMILVLQKGIEKFSDQHLYNSRRNGRTNGLLEMVQSVLGELVKE